MRLKVLSTLCSLANAILGKTDKPDRVDTATRMAMHADFSPEQDRTEPQLEPPQETDPLDELMRIVSKTPSFHYRLQFLGAGTIAGRRS